MKVRFLTMLYLLAMPVMSSSSAPAFSELGCGKEMGVPTWVALKFS